MARYRVLALADRAAFDAWRDEAAGSATGDAFRAALAARAQASGETILLWQGAPGEGPQSFMWTCPGCGGTYGGNLGERAVSGWDAPAWVNTGTLTVPTLSPSLGCPRWRDGQCDGHWWLRDGVLTTA